MWEREQDLAHRIPPGQRLTQKWPVLTYGATPRFDPRQWSFRCFGLVEQEVAWTWEEFLKLPRVEIISDVHCVTHWSLLDNRWEGVRIREILKHVRVRPEAIAVLVHADPDYTTNLALGELVDDDVLLALKHGPRVTARLSSRRSPPPATCPGPGKGTSAQGPPCHAARSLREGNSA